MTQAQVQLGKNGITENFIATLENHFNKHNNVKVSVLKSVERNKEKMKEFREELLNRLGNNYTAKIIGFSISLKKWRKNVRE